MSWHVAGVTNWCSPQPLKNSKDKKSVDAIILSCVVGPIHGRKIEITKQTNGVFD